MRHTLHSAALLHLDGDHKALAANGDQFFLQRAALRKPPQISLQRLLDGSLLLLDVAAQSGELERSAVIQRSVRQDLIAEVAQQRREVSDAQREFAHRLPL